MAFDVNSQIDIDLRTVAGKVAVTIRFPSDADWLVHRKKRKVLIKQLGRGQSETDIDTGAADLALYEAIKQNGAPPLTTGEAQKVISAIGLCDVINVELGADEAEVVLNILGGEARHFLRIPTLDDVRELNRSTRMITLPYNRIEVRASLDASAHLWAKCMVRVEGYESAVPNIHQDFAIHAVINAIDQEMTTRYDERNF